MKNGSKLMVVCFTLLQAIAANGQTPSKPELPSKSEQPTLKRYPIKSEPYGNFGVGRISFSLELPAPPQKTNQGGDTLDCLRLASPGSYVSGKSEAENISVTILAWEGSEKSCMDAVMGRMLILGGIADGQYKITVTQRDAQTRMIFFEVTDELHRKFMDGGGYLRDNMVWIILVNYTSGLLNGNQTAERIVRSIQ